MNRTTSVGGHRPDRRVVLGTLLTLVTAAGAAEKIRILSAARAPDSANAEHRSKVVLGDSLVRLVRVGMLAPEKLRAIYAGRGGIPQELDDALLRPSQEPIVLTTENANTYVTLLWPIGLGNRIRANVDSPLNGRMRFRFASTGGWTLGTAPNGGFDFNRHRIVDLSREQDARVARVARETFRPCCDNSTFFQDCNHGSALLGLLALGAAQGLTEDELFGETLAFNAHWFPDQYARTAAFFKSTQGLDWAQLDPRVVMSAKFSSASGWRTNVASQGEPRGLRAPPTGPGCAV